MTEQAELPGMPEDGPLAISAKKFTAEKDTIAAAKLRMADLEIEILSEMKIAGVPRFKLSAGGENYEFELVPGQDALRCAKITKTVKPAKPEAEPAVA